MSMWLLRTLPHIRVAYGSRLAQTLMGASVAWPFAVKAQQPGRTYRYGIVAPFPCESAPINIALSDEMRRWGFINGQNLTINCHEFGANNELSSQYAGDLVRAKVDVIVAWGDVAIRAAQHATKTIPILAMTDDMLGSGLVNSLARPNGNTTGVTVLATELDGKRQEILIEAVPGIRGMAALGDISTTTDAKLHALQEAAHAVSSFQCIGSPGPRMSQQPSTWRRHRAPRRSTFWRHLSFGPFVS
jgi:putative ABC transport system substrate-binding protein